MAGPTGWVCLTMARTPTTTARSVWRTWMRWAMIRIRATAVIPTIKEPMASVTQACGAIADSPFFSAEQSSDRAGVAHGSDRDFIDGAVGRGQVFGQVVEISRQGHPSTKDFVTGGPD